MSLSKKRIFLVLGVAAVAAVAALGLFLRDDGAPTAPASPSPSVTSSPSPSPAPDALDEADRRLLTRLSTELAVKYRSFDRVDQAYVDSIRPYLTKQFLEDYRETLRYADRAPFLQPMRSKALETSVRGDSQAGTATAVVRLQSTDLRTQERFPQTLEISWKRSGERWSATDIHALEFGKE